MMGGFVSRILLLVFGYAYPAYECYKIVELNKPEIEQLMFWCQYSILVALMTVMERFGDLTISWLPFYSEAKVLFFIYLWYPRTKGATYIYGTFFKPYISQHENEIDRNFLELRAHASDVVVVYVQKVTAIGQNTFFDVLKYVASQSPSQKSKQQRSQVRIMCTVLCFF
ncbi:putative HVA22-like protein g [Hordeum vulgare subsp. vulgare]|uniref:putative HVA22-like protein g n=1 Tax=Hordeum vulgare subsp. vulgare TaxID=112509 RepID=UPI001D1A3D0A|nr:putative HVA22-like protein g [Hordeum vulgare subsp. vulgare]